MASSGPYNNVAYAEVMDTDRYSTVCVYSVNSGQLPSHVRTVSPKYQSPSGEKEAQVDERNVDEKGDRTCVSLSCVRLVILITIFLITSSVAVYVSIFQINTNDPDAGLTRNQSNTTAHYRPAPHQGVYDLADYNKKGRGQPTDRSSCVGQCIPYRGPRFRSQCKDRYCVCDGGNYQRLTCLPVVDDCIIKKTYSDAYMNRNLVTSFTCHVATSSNVHVISVYGNHFSDQTVVNLSGSRQQGATIVLASRYSVRWKLKCSHVDLRRVILVSDRHFGSRDLSIDCDRNKSELPVISSVGVPFGYGDDRYGMDTVHMLKVITNTFGDVSSFTGAEFADYINVKM